MPKPEEKSQIDKFRDAARELVSDQSDETFEAAVNKVAKAPKLSAQEIKALAQESRKRGR